MREVKKILRTFLQVALLFGVVFFAVRAHLSEPKYVAAANETTEKDHPFIALSYTSIDDMGTDRVMDAQLFEQHMAALSEAGYQTITQKDIYDYYTNNKKLPEKALFLMFEDGRRDTALYAQPVLEKYNFKATMFTYAKQLDAQDPRFLNRTAVKELDRNSYWDVATNGYRFEYINTYDRHDNYVGRLTSNDFNQVREYIGKYNHYLMDYIRDEDELPLESRVNMVDRIDSDYHKLQQVYDQTLGYVPGTYAIMHANSQRYGVNDAVSDANEANIKEVFQLTFNQTGYALNDKKKATDRYDLSRYNVAYNCSVNHLLKELEYELGESDLPWIGAPKGTFAALKDGLGTVDQNELVLTTDLDKSVSATLAEGLTDFTFEATLKGSQAGSQGLKVLDDQGYLTVELQQEGVKVITATGGKTTLLEEYTYEELANKEKRTIAEDKALTAKEIESKAKEYITEVPENLHDDQIYLPTAKAYVEYELPVKMAKQAGKMVLTIADKVVEVPVADNGSYALEVSGAQADLATGENWKDPVYDVHVIDPLLIDRGEVLINLKNSKEQKQTSAKNGLKRLVTHLDLV